MRFKTWPVAALGLGALLLLIVGSMLTLSRKAQEIYAELDQLNAYHRDVDTKLRRLRSDVNLSGIFVRDYLLDVARERATDYRTRLTEFRTINMATLNELRAVTADPVQVESLQDALDSYWMTFDPLFDWTTAEKVIRSAAFLRREVVPRREAVLGIAQQIEELNNSNVTAQRAEVNRRQAAFSAELRRLLWMSGLLGFAVAAIVAVRLRVLERRSEAQRAGALDAERQLRQLSQQIVATQEAERKNLSRELHDHVAQVLTGLRLALGRIERTSARADADAVSAVAECRRLVDEIFGTVRDLSLGLRPSMLDDFGLEPALEWHVRDFSRRSGLAVDLHIEGAFAHLPDRYRICIYRAVQEALTNCARHAKATRADVTVAADAQSVLVVVQDDGVGLDPQRRHTGLGLRGIDERVKELEGVLTIRGQDGGGTALAIRLPAPSGQEEAALARVAG
jgi:signal transduction histidine kinase